MHRSILAQPTSATGQMHALPRRSIAVRFTPNEQTPAGRVECGAMCHSRLVRCSKFAVYSITSSAMASSVGRR